jgi:hypothetical protein
MSSVFSVVKGVVVPTPAPEPCLDRRRRAYIRLFTKALPMHVALLGVCVCTHIYNTFLLGKGSAGMGAAAVLTVGMIVARVQLSTWADQDAALRVAGHGWCGTLLMALLASIADAHSIDFDAVIAAGKLPMIGVVVFLASVLAAFLQASLDLHPDVSRPTMATIIAVQLLKCYMLQQWVVRGLVLMVCAVYGAALYLCAFLFDEAAEMNAYRVEKDIDQTAHAALEAAIAHKKLAKLEAALLDAKATVDKYQHEQQCSVRHDERGGVPLFAKTSDPPTVQQPTVEDTQCARLAKDVTATVEHALNDGGCASPSVATLDSSGAPDVEIDSSFTKTKRKLRAPIHVTDLSQLTLCAELRRLKHGGRGCGSAA